MMDQEATQAFDDDIEDGELSGSSDEVYTPLQRPANNAAASNTITTTTTEICSPLATCHQMQSALEEDESQADSSSDSTGESSEASLEKLTADVDRKTRRKRKKQRVRRTVMVRVPTTDAETQEKRARFKKYNIWTAALQEEALTENMRGCDVTRGGCNDRNVENYDYSLRYRLNGENSLKRRLSNSADDLSDSELHHVKKRGRQSSHDRRDATKRGSVKSRLGHRSRKHERRGSSPTSGSDNSYEPRYILDLSSIEGRETLDVAREIANKLYEEKDELLVRIIEVLGLELPIEIFKETQRIEADGGMMIKNGMRRRTPGGVFLFLLKNHDDLTTEQRKSIFAEERQNLNRWHKEKKALSRDRKVEELKKLLSKQERELPALSTRKDHFLLGSELSLENQTTNLSNPPPSPVGNEHSPDYKTHAINHVTDAIIVTEKPSTSASALAALANATNSSPTKNLLSYDDDFLDVNCGEMDFF